MHHIALHHIASHCITLNQFAYLICQIVKMFQSNQKIHINLTNLDFPMEYIQVECVSVPVCICECECECERKREHIYCELFTSDYLNKLIILSNAHGSGWATHFWNTSFAHRICCDSTIIQMVSTSIATAHDKKYSYNHINQILSNLLKLNPNEHIIPDNFNNLIICMVPVNRIFQIVPNDGLETIELFR